MLKWARWGEWEKEKEGNPLWGKLTLFFNLMELHFFMILWDICSFSCSLVVWINLIKIKSLPYLLVAPKKNKKVSIFLLTYSNI